MPPPPKKKCNVVQNGIFSLKFTKKEKNLIFFFMFYRKKQKSYSEKVGNEERTESIEGRG